jgi:hypothetical protein
MTPAQRREVQRAIARGQIQIGAPRARAAVHPAQRARGGRCTYRCGTCGEVSKAWAAAQRHADTHGGARVEIVL